MEKLLRRKREDPGLEPFEHGPSDPMTPAGSPLAASTVQLIWGPIAEPMALVGMTVGDVRRLLQGPYNIPRQAAALVNGDPADTDHRLATGDVLEFVRRAGEKG